MQAPAACPVFAAVNFEDCKRSDIRALAAAAADRDFDPRALPCRAAEAAEDLFVISEAWRYLVETRLV